MEVSTKEMQAFYQEERSHALLSLFDSDPRVQDSMEVAWVLLVGMGPRVPIGRESQTRELKHERKLKVGLGLEQ